jgi:hypothetical protein
MCEEPIGGTIVFTSTAPGLHVKTLDRYDLDKGDVVCRQPLGCVIVELWYPAISIRCHQLASLDMP